MNKAIIVLILSIFAAQSFAQTATINQPKYQINNTTQYTQYLGEDYSLILRAAENGLPKMTERDIKNMFWAMDQFLASMSGNKNLKMNSDPAKQLYPYYKMAAIMFSKNMIISAQAIMEEAARHPQFVYSQYGNVFLEVLRNATIPPEEDVEFINAVKMLNSELQKYNRYKGKKEYKYIEWALRGGLWGDQIAIHAANIGLNNLGQSKLAQQVQADASKLSRAMRTLAAQKKGAAFEDED